MVLRWSTSKIVFNDPDLGSKWPPSADIVYVKTMSAHGSHLGWRSWSPDTILKVYYSRTIHAMFALNLYVAMFDNDNVVTDEVKLINK
jgi:hypothetical protein